MSFFSRNRHNRFNEIVKREQERYGANSPANDPVVINRKPAARGEQSIGQTAESLTELQRRLCPACQIAVAGLLKKSEPSSGNGPKHDVFGDNLGTRRTQGSSRPVDMGEALGVGQNESPQRAALSKREAERVKAAIQTFFKL